MIFTELLLVDPPSIFHLKRIANFNTGLENIAFYGTVDTTQPLVTRLKPCFRDWARKHYTHVFAATANDGQPWGGLWIRRYIDLVWVDNAFCASSLYKLSVSMTNVTQLAVDATLLNDIQGRDCFVSRMDELLDCFCGVKSMVFMAPTKHNNPLNRYRGLRLVDQEEEESQKHLAFNRFYHCGAVVTNPQETCVMFSRSSEARDRLMRTRLHWRDRLRSALANGSPCKVILFQRQNMRAPSKDTVTGPPRSTNKALSKIASRTCSAPISASELVELVRQSMVTRAPARPTRPFPLATD